MAAKKNTTGKHHTVNICGQDVGAFDPPLTWIIFSALASLEDPKVDALLKNFNVVLKDKTGVTFWPPEKKGHVQHASVGDLLEQAGDGNGKAN